MGFEEAELWKRMGCEEEELRGGWAAMRSSDEL